MAQIEPEHFSPRGEATFRLYYGGRFDPGRAAPEGGDYVHSVRILQPEVTGRDHTVIEWAHYPTGGHGVELAEVLEEGRDFIVFRALEPESAILEGELALVYDPALF